MFDFAKIGDIAGTLETGIRDMDSRLQSIENLMLTLIALTAIDVSERYRDNTGFPADVTGVIDLARSEANAWRKAHASPPTEDTGNVSS